MSNYKKYFKLMGFCIPVKGIKESIICDIHNERYLNIPNLLYDILTVNKEYNYSVDNLKGHFENNLSNGIDSYFDYLAKNNFGFFTEISDLFIPIKNNFYTPSDISNSIIEINENSKFSLTNLIIQLEELGCKAIELRFNMNIKVDQINSLLLKFKESRIRCFNLLLQYYKNLEINKIKSLLYTNRRINKIIIHSISDKIEAFKEQNLILINEDVTKENNSSIFFIINSKTFFEAMNYNLGLNKKICIDQFGYIKNCLSHKKIYGNIKNDNISVVMNNDKFKFNWFVKNDQIEKCKDCQYRYICYSTSEVNSVKNKNYKVYNCKFDPYLNKWS